jgi:hypothetical protein
MESFTISKTYGSNARCIKRSKDQLLEDQKVALASIYESRSHLAEERGKVEALQKNFQEQKHKDMLQNATVKIEIKFK